MKKQNLTISTIDTSASSTQDNSRDNYSSSTADTLESHQIWQVSPFFSQDKLITLINYCGYSTNIYYDNTYECYWCEIDGDIFSFNKDNLDYERDVYCIIDSKLD